MLPLSLSCSSAWMKKSAVGPKIQLKLYWSIQKTNDSPIHFFTLFFSFFFCLQAAVIERVKPKREKARPFLFIAYVSKQSKSSGKSTQDYFRSSCKERSNEVQAGLILCLIEIVINHVKIYSTPFKRTLYHFKERLCRSISKIAPRSHLECQS